MSLDIDRVLGLLNIVEKAAMHPAKLAPLGTLAMKELEERSTDAKKEHDKFLADQAREAAAKKADADAKAKKLADADAKSAELTSRPQEVKRPTAPVARPAAEFRPEADEAEPEESVTEPVRRREVPEEATHG